MNKSILITRPQGQADELISALTQANWHCVHQPLLRICPLNEQHGAAFHAMKQHIMNLDIYDVVISQEVIEHIEDQEKYLENCFRVLKKGGYLIMTTPNKKVFDHMKDGNWSKQPIEKILTPKSFKNLI